MAGTLVRDVRATLDIEVAKAQAGLRDLEKAGAKTEKALSEQERAAKGYERQLAKTGSAATSMRRRLEAATRALPKITIDADSAPADKKMSELREKLAGLAGKKIGIDVTGTDALAEIHAIKAELAELAATEADPVVRADVQIASRELERIDAQLQELNAETVEVPVEVKADDIGPTAAAIRATLEAATAALPPVEIDADSSEADVKIANIRASLTDLADKRIGVDVDSGTALAEVALLKAELEWLDRADIDPVVKADVRNALDGLSAVQASLGVVGSTAEGAMGVIGKAGPANVAIAVAAIEMLPAAAQLAAAGIGVSIGSALAGVGLQVAAESDVVKHAWKETGEAIKAELADAASPLEGSAVKAADVALETFQRLKPALARIWGDLVPDVDRFIDAVGNGVVRLAPGLERIGASFGNLLSGLSDQMPSIMNNLNSTFETFSDIMDENPQMLANVVKDATELLRVGAEVLSWADEIKAGLSLATNPGASSDFLWQQIFGMSHEEFLNGSTSMSQAMTGVQEALALAAEKSRELGGSGDEAAGGIRSLSQALEELFEPASKALDAEIKLKQAIDEAAQAAKDKKMSELERLQAVQSLTGALAEAATAENERTGKTTAAGQAFAEQLPKLIEWAGKNTAARDTVLALGDSLGITIKRTEDGSIAVDKFGKAVITLPNGKQVKIDAETAAALAAIDKTQRVLDGMKNKTVYIDVITRSMSRDAGIAKQTQAYQGAIMRYAAGGIERYAAGGMRPQPPQIVSRPTVLFGEGSSGKGATEAFIPYEARYRQRAVGLLAEVAGDFGFGLYGAEADAQVQQVATHVSDAAAELGAGLGTVDDTLVSVFGDTGTLTSAVTGVGTVGTEMAQAWQTGSTQLTAGVADMSDQVGTSLAHIGTATLSSADMMANSTDGLTGSVKTLAEVIAEAKAAALAAANAKTSGGSGTGYQLEKSTRPINGGSGYQLEQGTIPLKPPDLIEGDYGNGGYVSPDAAFSVPVSSSSAPAASSYSSASSPVVQIENFHATPEQSPHEIAQELAWIGR